MNKDEKKRKEENDDLIKRMREGDSLIRVEASATWWAPRPIIKKDKDKLKQLFGEDKDESK